MPTDACGMIDVSCPKCRRRFGWAGRVVDRPPCPRCGFMPARADLEHDQQQLNDFRELLSELQTANPGWDKWQKARVAAGLTLRQASELIGMSAADLSAVERGEVKPSDEAAARMRQLYSGS